MKIERPGIYDVPEAAYHADPCAEPSASSSILRLLYEASPEHAWFAHPKLNPAWEPDAGSDASNAGTILHSLMLKTPAMHRVLDFPDFRTSASKEARDAAVEAGLIPILRHKLAEIESVVEILRGRLEREQPAIFRALNDPQTLKEATLVWFERGALCRVRYDALPPPEYGFSIDFKFTGRSAQPEAWSTKIRNDYLYQAGLYPRAVKKLCGDAPEFRFLVCETEPPYGISVHALAPDLEAIAERRVNAALDRWKECLRTKEWPGYPRLINYANAPAWFLGHDDERAIREQIARDGKCDLISLDGHPIAFA